jgi:hypothetical protein
MQLDDGDLIALRQQLIEARAWVVALIGPAAGTV